MKVYPDRHDTVFTIFLIETPLVNAHDVNNDLTECAFGLSVPITAPVLLMISTNQPESVDYAAGRYGFIFLMNNC